MQTRRSRPTPQVARTQVTAVVKWFNPNKGFGFVQLDDGSPDAFLHISVVEQAGRPTINEGATLVCDLAEGGRGLQVVSIHSVEGGAGNGTVDVHVRVAPPMDGVVKFFNAHKGFGFITPDDGSRDVFFSARILERSGLPPLTQAQRVRMIVRQGQKGPMVERLELIQ